MASPQADPVTQRARARVGLVLREKWRLDSLLGVGGMAAVYAATHRNGKRGAVKMLHLELSTDADARRRFLREGYVANAVDHPGAVSVLDDDVAEDGSVFLVMELLEGQTVDARAESRAGAKLPADEVLAIADQLLDALAAAHRKGIVHRDLKPENLFLTRTGQLKVLDFGLARLQDLSAGSRAQRMTATGSAMGTPAFMPPEQALGNWDTVDARTDLWAVGATMFNLLTGRFVHEADTLNKLLLAAMTKPSRPIAIVDPTVPPPVAVLVDRALAFEQKDRWPDAASMQAAVRAARAGIGARGVSLAGGPAPAHAAAALGTQATQRVPLVSSLAPTSAEPRRSLRKTGLIAGVLAGGAIGGTVLVLALRAHAPAAGSDAAAAPIVPAAEPATAAPAPSASVVQVTPASATPSESAAPASAAPTAEPAPRPSASPSVPPTPPGSARVPRPRPTAAPKASADPFQKW